MKHLITLALILIVSIGVKAQTAKKDTTTAFKLTCDTCKTTADFISDTSKHLTITAAAFPKMYIINWSRITSLRDLKLVMQCWNIQISDNIKNFKQIKKYLIEAK
jgi:general stress protein CsbA